MLDAGDGGLLEAGVFEDAHVRSPPSIRLQAVADRARSVPASLVRMEQTRVVVTLPNFVLNRIATVAGLQSLMAFAETVKHGSFAGAARELGLSPSAVAKSVARLEDDLGVRLFHRTTRKVALTSEGHELHRRCRVIVDEFDALRDAAAGARGAPSGTLRINVPVTYGKLVVLPKLAALLRRHPRITLDVGFSDRYADIVSDGLDAAIRVGHLADSSLVARRIGEQTARGGGVAALPAQARRAVAPFGAAVARVHGVSHAHHGPRARVAIRRRTTADRVDARSAGGHERRRRPGVAAAEGIGSHAGAGLPGDGRGTRGPSADGARGFPAAAAADLRGVPVGPARDPAPARAARLAGLPQPDWRRRGPGISSGRGERVPRRGSPAGRRCAPGADSGAHRSTAPRSSGRTRRSAAAGRSARLDFCASAIAASRMSSEYLRPPTATSFIPGATPATPAARSAITSSTAPSSSSTRPIDQRRSTLL